MPPPANRRGSATRQALLEEALRLIASEGVEAASILRVTKNLKLSNGIFYYHFRGKEQLLEEVGQMIVSSLVNEIQSAVRPDVASRIAIGPLLILNYVDRHPELHVLILRVLDDPLGVHASLAEGLAEDLRSGQLSGRFAISDLEMAVMFCRAIVASAARAEHHGRRFEDLGGPAAIHTLTMLGIEPKEATEIVERELQILRASKIKQIAAALGQQKK